MSSTDEGGAGEIKLGCLYFYVDLDGLEKAVQVVSIDHSVEPPSYCILIDGAHRETEGARLKVKSEKSDGAAAAGGQPPSRIPIPDSFRCPISGDLMVSPMIDPEGNSYDRASIEQWLARSPTSPITRSRLTADMLKPNRALADSIATFKPLLEIEEAPGAPHPEVTRALEEETAFQDGSMWIGRVKLQVVRATALPKADAIVVISNGSSHMRKVPEKAEDTSFKTATPSVGGKEPQWKYDVVFPAAVPVGVDDGRQLVLHVKHLAVGKQWTGNNEGEWLGKVTIKMSQIVTSGAQGQQISVPILKGGAAVGAAQLHLVMRSEATPYAVFALDVSKKTEAALAYAPRPKQDVMGFLNKGVEFLQTSQKEQARGPSAVTSEEYGKSFGFGQDIGAGARDLLGLPQIFTPAQMEAQKRLMEDTLAREGTTSEGRRAALQAVNSLVEQQKQENAAPAAAARR